jgi:hypothetical protein
MGMGLLAIGGQVAVTSSMKVNFLGALRRVWPMSAECHTRQRSLTMHWAPKTALPGA